MNLATKLRKNNENMDVLLGKFRFSCQFVCFCANLMRTFWKPIALSIR